MAKWSGKIGYFIQEETCPGIWTEDIVEKQYYGDLIKNYKNNVENSQINDGININNQLSIVSDPYAIKNFHLIRYATFMDTKWKVTSVDVAYPRLVLSLGGAYND